MKKTLIFAVLLIFPLSAKAGPAANVSYVHQYFAAKTGVSVAIKSGAVGTAAANMQYLLALIDRANTQNAGAGSVATDYKSNVLATTAAIDTKNVWLGAANLFNCKAGGYYKNGSINTTDGTGSVSCQTCVAGNYCVAGSESQAACSSLSGASPSGGTYASAAGSSANTQCGYTASGKTIPGCSSVTANQVMYSGSSWPASTYSVSASGGYKVANNNTASATCAQCSGAEFSAGGSATSCTSCPAATSGWTRATGTGWQTYTSCYQTRNAADISSYCSAGQLKQTASSATAWGSSVISAAFQAQAGSYVSGQTCAQCAAGTYGAGGSATSCTTCNSGFTTSGAGKSAATDCTRACTTSDISGSYSVSGTINQTQSSTSCTLVSCAAQYYKNGSACTNCASGCSTSQNCTPSGCTVSNGTCTYNTNSGTQTRSAACTNGNGNSSGLMCDGWGTCSGATKNVTCDIGYTPQNQNTANASCLLTAISSATSPDSCTVYTSTSSVDDNKVASCTGGEAAGNTVSSFVVGGYCSSTIGDGAYTSPVIQTCSDCIPATTSTVSKSCYCKLHAVNDMDVVPSTRYVFISGSATAAACAKDCASNCAYFTKTKDDLRTALFNAIGS